MRPYLAAAAAALFACACDDATTSADGDPPDAAIGIDDAAPTPDAASPDVAFLDGAPPDAAATCAAGEVRCDDATTRATCGDDGAWVREACPAGEVCADGACGCVPGTVVGCEGPHHVRLCDGLEACPAGLWCADGACGEPTCVSDDDCHSDTFCGDGRCVPYPAEPRGENNGGCRLAIQVGDFSPEVQCHWGAGQVGMQPIAIDLDGDEVPSILFVAGGQLVAIRGDDCTEEMRAEVGVLMSGESSIAAGDIDADGLPEVVAMGGIGQLFAFDENLEMQWVAAAGVLGLATAPAVADLDGDGRGEVIVGATAYNGEDGSVHGQSPLGAAQGFGPIPAVADVDGDGQQEVLYGNRIFDSQMADVTPDAMRRLSAGHVAIADFDLDSPGPELAVIHGTSRVRIQRLDGTVIFGPYAIPGSMWGGGAPNVADFDGDGRPEIGSAGSHNYAVFDQDCVGDPLPADCEAEGIRWTKAVRDTSSGSTGSTTFDFEGDGRVEVVYNDECFLRVYDGTTGDVLLAHANTTGTLIEAPIVLDVDGDYNSEIVVASDRGFSCVDPDPDTGAFPRQTQGITVVRDITDRWVHSRPIWNQNAYAITNVEDDGTLPARPEANWEKFNSFRENAQPEDKALEAPDVTVRGDASSAREGCGPARLAASIHNRGAQPVSGGIVVSFFAGDPANGGAEVCSTRTTRRLVPGDAEVVACDWLMPPMTPTVVHVMTDTNPGVGAVMDRNAECAERNNWTTLLVPGCP